MQKDIILYHSGHFSADCNCSFCINKKSIAQSLSNLNYNVAILQFKCDWDKLYPSKIHFDYALLYQNKMFGQFMFEASKMPSKVVDFANTYFDYIICGSSFLKDVWVNSGVDKKYLIGSCLGLDTKVFNTIKPKKYYHQDKFKFLIVGNWQHCPQWEDRKGMSIAIECFKELFLNNKYVELIVKSDSYAPNTLGSNNITLIKDRLSDNDMANLYKSVANNGAYLTTHKGEGFGKQSLEALCCGCNVGSTNFSGVKTFLNKSNSTLFDYTLSDWHIYPNDFYSDKKLPQFAVVNNKQVKEWMLYVYSNKVKKQYVDFNKYSWNNIVSKLMTDIKERT